MIAYAALSSLTRLRRGGGVSHRSAANSPARSYTDQHDIASSQESRAVETELDLQ